MAPEIVAALQALVALAVGVATGFAYFGILRRNLELYLDGSPALAVALQAGRFLIAAAVLFGAVQFGAVPLLACALGLLIGRHLVLRRVRKEE